MAGGTSSTRFGPICGAPADVAEARDFQHPGNDAGMNVRAARARDQVAHKRMTGHRLPRQRADLDHLPGKPRRLAPCIASRVVGIRPGLAIVRGLRPIGGRIPRMAQVFGDGARVKRANLAIREDATRKQMPFVASVSAVAHARARERAEFFKAERPRYMQETAEVTAMCRLLVSPGRKRVSRIQLHDAFEPVAIKRAFKKAAKRHENAGKACGLVGGNGTGRAAGLNAQRMRPLAGEDAEDMHELRARRQHVLRRGAFHSGETIRDVRVPRFPSIYLTREIRHEEQIEMRQMVGDILRRVDQVDGMLAAWWRLQSHGVGQRLGGGNRLRHRADTADARRVDQRIERRLAIENAFKTPIQHRDDARVADRAVRDVERDLKVTLDPVERSDDQPRHLRFFCLSTGGRAR